MNRLVKNIKNSSLCESVDYCCNMVELLNSLIARRPGYVSRFGEDSNQVATLDGEISAYKNAIHWFIGIDKTLKEFEQFVKDITNLNYSLLED